MRSALYAFCVRIGAQLARWYQELDAAWRRLPVQIQIALIFVVGLAVAAWALRNDRKTEGGR